MKNLVLILLSFAFILYGNLTPPEDLPTWNQHAPLIVLFLSFLLYWIVIVMMRPAAKPDIPREAVTLLLLSNLTTCGMHTFQNPPGNILAWWGLTICSYFAFWLTSLYFIREEDSVNIKVKYPV